MCVLMHTHKTTYIYYYDYIALLNKAYYSTIT